MRGFHVIGTATPELYIRDPILKYHILYERYYTVPLSGSASYVRI